MNHRFSRLSMCIINGGGRKCNKQFICSFCFVTGIYFTRDCVNGRGLEWRNDIVYSNASKYPREYFWPRNTSCLVTIKHVTHRKYKLSYLLHSCSKMCSITSSPSLQNNDSTRLNIYYVITSLETTPIHTITREIYSSHEAKWTNKLFITFPTTFIDCTHTETRKSVIH